MKEVLIHCPVTGKILPTGIALSEEAFAKADLRDQSVGCPHCGQRHGWVKRDAFLRR